MYVLSQEASGARTSSKAYSILSTKTHILTWCVKDFLKCLHTVGLASRSVGDERDTSPLGTSTDACKLQIDMQETCTVQRIDFSCICPMVKSCEAQRLYSLCVLKCSSLFRFIDYLTFVSFHV